MARMRATEYMLQGQIELLSQEDLILCVQCRREIGYMCGDREWTAFWCKECVDKYQKKEADGAV